METQKITPAMAGAISAIQHPRVQEIIKELSGYNLGVALPHIHQDGTADLLPDDKVQYENNLVVSFVYKKEFSKKDHSGFPVSWRWNQTKNRVEACAWCHDDE